MDPSDKLRDKRTGVLQRIPRALPHSGVQFPDLPASPAFSCDILVELPQPVLKFQFEWQHAFDDFGWNLNRCQKGTSGREASELLFGGAVYGDL